MSHGRLAVTCCLITVLLDLYPLHSALTHATSDPLCTECHLKLDSLRELIQKDGGEKRKGEDERAIFTFSPSVPLIYFVWKELDCMRNH